MKEFDEYTSNFDFDNKMIVLKYNHSYRVSKISESLAKRLNLEEKEVKLAKLIGMLHDIGRFEQIKKYNTLSDIKTIDHGDFGAYLLFNKGLISKFTIDVENYDVIKTSVKYHNKYSVLDNYDKKTLLHLNLIRDSDKLDILNIFANLNEVEFSSDGEISKKVKEQFYNNEIISNENKKTKADEIIGILSFVYDINFKESFDYIKQENFYKNIFERLYEKDKLKEYFEYTEQYVKNNL